MANRWIASASGTRDRFINFPGRSSTEPPIRHVFIMPVGRFGPLSRCGSRRDLARRFIAQILSGRDRDGVPEGVLSGWFYGRRTSLRHCEDSGRKNRLLTRLFGITPSTVQRMTDGCTVGYCSVRISPVRFSSTRASLLLGDPIQTFLS